MVRTQVYLPEDLYNQVHLLSRSSGTNFSTLLREGLSHVVAQRNKPKKKDWTRFVGAGGPGGPKDLSKKIDYYLYGAGNKKYG